MTVVTQSGCSWNPVSNVQWVMITALNAGGFTFSVQPNSGAARQGVISVAGQTFTVTQDGVSQPAACEYAVTFPVGGINYDYRGGNTGMIVSASRSDCTWNVTSSQPWIGLSQSAGSGNGNFTITVAGNSGAARSGTVTFTALGGFTRSGNVTQAAIP